MSEQVKGAASFAKNISVLQAIADATSPPNIANLMQHLNMPRPTLYRMLAALEAENMIEQDGLKCWHLGPRLIGLASKAWQNNDLRTIAHPFLENLRDQTGETIHLAIRNGYEMMYIDKVESREVVRMASTIGARVPFHSTSVGKAFLMALDESDRADILNNIPYPQITEHSAKSKTELAKQFKHFEKSGYVMEREENEIGVACFGGAILDHKENPIGAISVSIPLYRIKDEFQFYNEALEDACIAISKKMPPF